MDRRVKFRDSGFMDRKRAKFNSLDQMDRRVKFRDLGFMDRIGDKFIT